MFCEEGPLDYKRECKILEKENERLRQELKDALAGQEYASWQFCSTDAAKSPLE